MNQEFDAAFTPLEKGFTVIEASAGTGKTWTIAALYLRLLLEDATLLREDRLTLHLRFKGGAHRTIQLPLPLRSWEQRQTSAEAVAEIDRLRTNTPIRTSLPS